MWLDNCRLFFSAHPFLVVGVVLFLLIVFFSMRNFDMVASVLPESFAPVFLVATTVAMCVTVEQCVRRFRNFSYNRRVNASSFNLLEVAFIPTDVRLQPMRVFKKVSRNVGALRNAYFWRRQHDFLDAYYIEDPRNDAEILRKVTAKAVNFDLLHKYFEQTLLSFIMDDAIDAIDNFTDKFVFGDWAVYYETVYQNRSSAAFREIAHYFRPQCNDTPDYIFVNTRSGVVIVVDSLDSAAARVVLVERDNSKQPVTQTMPDVVSKLRQYEGHMQGVTSFYVLCSGITNDNVRLGDGPTYSLVCKHCGSPDSGNDVIDLFGDSLEISVAPPSSPRCNHGEVPFDLMMFKQRMFSEHAMFYKEVMYWLSCNKNHKIERNTDADPD